MVEWDLGLGDDIGFLVFVLSWSELVPVVVVLEVPYLLVEKFRNSSWREGCGFYLSMVVVALLRNSLDLLDWCTLQSTCEEEENRVIGRCRDIEKRVRYCVRNTLSYTEW